MAQISIADRRQMRRKLTFWRVVSILVAGLAVLLAWYALKSTSESYGAGSDHIAQVTISGVIMDDRELVERLNTIADDDHAKALVVSISSPGGTTYGGEVIFKAIRRVAEKKPVVSDIRSLAASAGYMIATAGDTIIAGETSITGSIGVIFQYPQVKDLLDKIGVSLEEIKSSPMKAEPSPFHPPSDEAKAMIDNMVKDTYSWFIDLVAERRKLPRDVVARLADGSIYTGRQALENKLIDQIGGEAEIRDYLKTRKVDSDLKIIAWPAKRSTTSYFFGSMAREIFQSIGFDGAEGVNLLKNMANGKLFLDGLVSAWQIEQN